MKKAYWIPFSHLDLGFYGTRQEALSRGNRTVSRAMEMAGEEEDFRFLVETVNFVESFVSAHPEKVEELRRLVHAGKIELLPEWSGTFQSCVDGEVMVRNILYSKTFLGEKFGVNSPSIQFTDTGELTPQIPQILRGLEVHHCVNSRGGPEGTVLYWMEGLDGSRVLVLNQIFGYAWAMMYTKFGIRTNVEHLQETKFADHLEWLSQICPVPAGMEYGLDGLVPRKNVWAVARRWNAQSDAKILFATLSEYFNAIKKQEGASKIPVLKGELRGVWVGGTGASPGSSEDVETISTLLAAEKFATVSYLLGKLEDPTRRVREIWTRILNAFDHNGGPENKVDRQLARISTEYLLRRALVSIAENVEAPKGENVVPIVVFNPLSWRRDGIVSLHYSQYSTRWEMPFCNSDFVFKALSVDVGHEPENLEVTDSAGKIAPCEGTVTDRFLLPNGTLMFKAEAVPPLGYKTYYLRFKEKTPPVSSDLRSEEKDGCLIATNSKVRLKVDKASGAMFMEDPETGKTLVKDAQPILYELTEKGVWVKEVNFSKPHLVEVEKVEAENSGPVKLETRVSGELLGAKIQVVATLYRETKAVDVTVKVKSNFEKKGFLVFDVPTTLSNPRIDYGVPYGTNSWENYVDKCKPGDETPFSLWKSMRNMEKFLRLSDENSSVVIASYGKGFRKEDQGVSLTMYYSPFAEEEGHRREEVTFKHRFIIEERDEAKKAHKVGWEFTSPLIPIGVYDTDGEKTLPAEQSFCNTASESAVVTVVKKAENSDNIIVRYYEAEGKETASEVQFIRETEGRPVNMLEHAPKEAAECDNLRPFEIRTVKFPIKDMPPRRM